MIFVLHLHTIRVRNDTKAKAFCSVPSQSQGVPSRKKIKFKTSMKNKFTITVLGKTLEFSVLWCLKQKLYRLVCAEVGFDDVFDAEDLAQFLASEDFEFFIADELRRRKKVKNRRIQIRVTEEEQDLIEEKAIKEGYKSTSSYVRHLALS